ncbi:hypothetical protein EJC47_06115 [Sphingomonas sp. TF3]|uniref:hypothetical protein n=2 Tax=Bacteria TaxID=2 RepID=UPI000F88CC73|nr:hypothetical protein [Sphingomonas sp. TF3]RUN77500.1 hypothetical protein EJC47_06115 [Sphingomonas sp. TF3]
MATNGAAYEGASYDGRTANGVTVGGIVAGGFRLIRERIAAVSAWALLYLVMNVLVVLAMRQILAGVGAETVTAQTTGVARDPALMMAHMSQMFGVYLMLMIGLLVLYTAGLRAALRPGEGRFAYLRLSMDEVRMLLVALLLWVGFFLLYLVLALVVGLVGGVVAVAARGAMVPVFILLGLAAFAVLIYFYVRFSLAFALTMQRGKIMIGESWNLTKGRFWTLFAAYLVVGLIVTVVSVVLLGLTQGSYIAEMAQGGFRPEAVQAAQRHQMEQQFGAITGLTVVGWVLGAVLMTLWITLAAGVAGAATTALRDDAFADIGAVYE